MNKKSELNYLILGHGRHGKDTVAEILAQQMDLEFQSSSWAALDIIYPMLQAATNGRFESPAEAFFRRDNYRQLWAEAICLINAFDKAALAKHIMASCNMYVGMRSNEEYEAAMNAGLFDVVIYVTAWDRAPMIDPTMKIPYDPVKHILIPNNDSLEELNTYLYKTVWPVLRDKTYRKREGARE